MGGRLTPERFSRSSAGLIAHERQEFVAGLFVVAERAEHGASNSLAVLLFHAAHLHAQVARFDDYADALRRDFFLDGFGDLAGHAFLNLQATGKHVDQPGDFAQTDYLVAWQVSDVRFAKKRE